MLVKQWAGCAHLHNVCVLYEHGRALHSPLAECLDAKSTWITPVWLPVEIFFLLVFWRELIGMFSPSSMSSPTGPLNTTDLPLAPVNYTDVTQLPASPNVSSLVHKVDIPHTYTDTRPPKEFPLALVIASPVVAVFILVFFCVSYYWHASYLDRQARKLAIRMAADVETGIRPSRRTRRGAGTDGRKSGRSRRLSSPTPSVPKRTSSAVTDQEILSHFAARRHSTFFI